MSGQPPQDPLQYLLQLSTPEQVTRGLEQEPAQHAEATQSPAQSPAQSPGQSPTQSPTQSPGRSATAGPARAEVRGSRRTGSQRAVAAGSPGPRWLAAGGAAAYALLLAVMARLGPFPLAAAVVVLQAAAVAGWVRACRIPGTGAAVTLGSGVALGADAVLLAASAPASGLPPVSLYGVEGLALLAPVPALAVPAVFGLLLTRRGGGAHSLTSLTGIVAGVTLAVLTAFWLPAARTEPGAAYVALVAMAGGAVLEGGALRGTWSRPHIAAGTVLLAVPGGMTVSFLLPFVGATHGAVLGFATGLVTAAGYAAAAQVRARADGHGGQSAQGGLVPKSATLVLAAALPLSAVAPAAYLVGRVLPG